MPGLMIFRATLRWTGWSCSAMKTTPMPPSPISLQQLVRADDRAGALRDAVARPMPAGSESRVAWTSAAGWSRKLPALLDAPGAARSTSARSSASPPQACFEVGLPCSGRHVRPPRQKIVADSLRFGLHGVSRLHGPHYFNAPSGRNSSRKTDKNFQSPTGRSSPSLTTAA